MTDRTLTTDADPATGSVTTSESGEPPFELTPSDVPGEIPARTIDELRVCYREAKDYTAALRDAIKAQAEVHKIKPAALRRYIAALEGDTIDDAEKEAIDLAKLIEAGLA